MERPGRLAQGDFGEKSRMEQHQANDTPAVDLNSLERFQKAANAPLYDLSTSETFESVKAYNNVDRAMSHLCDLQASESWESSTQKGLREKFAQSIVENAEQLQEAGAYPEGLPLEPTVEEVKNFEREHGMAIFPDDIAEEVRENLPQEIRESPEPWGVDPASETFDSDVQERAAELSERVQGFGKDSAECEQCAQENAEGTVAANQGSLGDLAMPQPDTAEAFTGAEPAESSGQSAVSPTPEPPPMSTPGA